MKKRYFWVACGGILGSWVRYGLRDIAWLNGAWPWHTLLANVLGCFLLAACSFGLFSWVRKSPGLALFLAAGFCGSLTTFSTWCKEIVLMWQMGRPLSGLAYLAVSCLLGTFVIALAAISLKGWDGDELDFSWHRWRLRRRDPLRAGTTAGGKTE